MSERALHNNDALHPTVRKGLYKRLLVSSFINSMMPQECLFPFINIQLACNTQYRSRGYQLVEYVKT